MQILHSAIKNMISLYQQSLNELKNTNIIKSSIISKQAGQVNMNCLFNCHMSGPRELWNKNSCHLARKKFEFYEFLIMWYFQDCILYMICIRWKQGLKKNEVRGDWKHDSVICNHEGKEGSVYSSWKQVCLKCIIWLNIALYFLFTL